MEQRVLKSLLTVSAYPEFTTSVHLIQTHVSFIFITDNTVYKVKKSVDFGFLNFTTLDRRRFYCQEEVRLNHRLCPGIYLGVVELREAASGAAFFGSGKVLDYAVKMKRLPEERMLDRLVREDKVSESDIRHIARKIAEFHLKAERSEEIDNYGSTESIRRNWDENIRQMSESSTVTIAGNDLHMIREWIDRFLNENRLLLEKRVSDGFIRDCDGDIHMANICLTDDVVIFDCIEFNNRFRYSDTAADVAFLLMDLDYNQCTHFSDLFLSEYVALTEDGDIGRLLTFYKTYRAFVRGKVENYRLHDSDILLEEKEAARDRSIRYFRLARGYIIRRKLPQSLMITSGLTGSGKSTIASLLTIELGLCRISSDEVRKEISHLPKQAHDYSGYAQGIYTADVDEATYGELFSRTEAALAEGRSVIVDATFRRKCDRTRFQSLAKRHSLSYYILQTVSSEELSHRRLEKRSDNPLEVSDGRWEVFQRQKEEFEPIGADEQQHFYLDTCRPLYDTADTVLRSLGLL